jgi:CDP-2,3-bis-(O-geranylgeranyl)-sn-glycerol synthase
LLLLLGIANGMPVLARKMCKDRLATPVDGGIAFVDGRPLFGRSKTIRGVVVSIAFTSVIGLLLGFDLSIGAALASLSMLGDLASSFVKRRLGFDSHAQAFGLDQIPEALLPLLVLQKPLGLTWIDILLVVLAFVLLGVLLSRMLYKIGIREQPH